MTTRTIRTKKEGTTAPHVLVIGASGELGGALARIYASQGASLSLWGRDVSRLDDIARSCACSGATAAKVRSIDLEDLEAALFALRAEDDAAPFDIALLAAGQGDIREPDKPVDSPGTIARLGRVNFLAPAALCSELGARMAQRGRGTIVVIGSAAAFHALPFASAYAGSKAGLARFTGSLRIALRPHGVSVTLVSPGFIDTAAARRIPGPKPMALSTQEAADKIVAAAARGKAHLIMPWPFVLLRLLDRALARPLRDKLLRALTPSGW